MNKKLKLQILGIIFGLSFQYILGMIVNMFVSFPESGSEEQMWQFTKTQIPLVLHIIIGLGLVITASTILARAIKAKEKNLVIAAVVGFLAILVSVIAGSLFVPSQKDLYSFVMALGFIVAMLSYVMSLYLS